MKNLNKLAVTGMVALTILGGSVTSLTTESVTAQAATKSFAHTQTVKLTYTLNSMDSKAKTKKIKNIKFNAKGSANVKAPTIAGYQPNHKTIEFRSDGKTTIQTTYLNYTKKKAAKKQAYKISGLKAQKTKSGKSVKVTGKVAVATKALAKKHKATYVRITNYNGKQYVKLTTKAKFAKTIKAKKAKKTSVVAGYYTGKTFHVLSATKKVTVKAYK